MKSNPPDQKSERARWMTWARNYVRHWYGQASVAALAALVCFLSMYSIYLYLSSQLPDGSKTYEKTGLYIKKNWSRGEPTSTLSGNSIYCSVSTFARSACLFDGSGNTVTVVIDKFPRIWGDVDVVVTAKAEQILLYDFDTEKISAFWKEKSVYDCFFFSLYAFVFTFLGLKGLNKQFRKE